MDIPPSDENEFTFEYDDLNDYYDDDNTEETTYEYIIDELPDKLPDELPVSNNSNNSNNSVNSNNSDKDIDKVKDNKVNKKVIIAEELNNILHIEKIDNNIIEYDRTVVETKKKKKSEIEEFIKCMDDVDKWATNCNPNKIFISKSSFTDDNKIIALIVKFKIIPYKCSGKGCNISTNWLDNPIQLLVIRKNNNNSDLTPNNLQLLCGNCYLVEYGMKLFRKGSDCVTIKCKSCGKDITSINKKYKKHIDFCYKCLNISIQEKELIDEERRIKELSKITGEDLTPTILQEIHNDDQAILQEKSRIVKKPRKTYTKSSSNSSRTGGCGSEPIIIMNTDAINITDLLKSYKKN